MLVRAADDSQDTVHKVDIALLKLLPLTHRHHVTTRWLRNISEWRQGLVRSLGHRCVINILLTLLERLVKSSTVHRVHLAESLLSNTYGAQQVHVYS